MEVEEVPVEEEAEVAVDVIPVQVEEGGRNMSGDRDS